MQSFGKFLRKPLLVFAMTILLLIALDVILFIIAFQGTVQHNYGTYAPTYRVRETAIALTNKNGTYELADSITSKLQQQNIWGMLIAEDGNVTWSLDLPEDIPLRYSRQDIARLSRYYLKDYPVFIWNNDDGIVVLGYPKDSYVKLTTNYLPYHAVQMMPLFFIGILGLDILLLFVVYTISKYQITKNIHPITRAISQLSKGQSVKIETVGDLAEIGNCINETSNIIIKKDGARANWITGVSHDIRTPLSMIMGYADCIAADGNTDSQVREQAEIIRKQGIKIKELVRDLNLTSQLEYDMQPLHKKKVLMAKLLREVIVEFLNNDLSDKYSIELEVDPNAQGATMEGDTTLIKRAIGNLIQNSINHNPYGCEMSIQLRVENERLIILICDYGSGVLQKELNAILSKSHAMNSTDDAADLRHGLGLQLVKKIVTAHNGDVDMRSDVGKGFCVRLKFPHIIQ